MVMTVSFATCKDAFFLVKKKWIGLIFHEIKYESFLYAYSNHKITDILIENLTYAYATSLYEAMHHYDNKKYITNYFSINLLIKLVISYFTCPLTAYQWQGKKSLMHVLFRKKTIPIKYINC